MVILPCSTYIFLHSFTQEMVQQLDITAMRRLVHSIITDHPGIVFDALDAMQAGDPNPPPPTPDTSNHPQ